MIALKAIAKTMTLDQFKWRFEKGVQGVRDRLTGNLYFCPNDFGFKLNRENCEDGFYCKECWEYAESHLKHNQLSYKRIE